MKRRDLEICLLSVGVALPAYAAGQALLVLIDLCTNLFYHGALSLAPALPGSDRWGAAAVAVPALGGLAVGMMARFGAKAIRGHGIPEAMEQILVNESRISHRVAWLKPLSAAVSIGSGGPFGAEGPIISTGAALGSLVGQWVPLSGRERKLLLAAGAAAGMASVFGTPVAAVLLALELLLFEFSPSAILAVGLASATAAGLRATFVGAEPVFPMPPLQFASGPALCFYSALGIPMGLVAVAVSRSIFAVEGCFERLPMHWSYWPVLGGLAVGVAGMLDPRVLGVGYENITSVLSGHMMGAALLSFAALKFVAWSLALGSGTSGGTLAPLLTIGGCLGSLMSAWAGSSFPFLGIDPRLGALVGMSALFAGCSGAVLASLVFAFEATHQMPGLLPLLLSSLISAALAKRLHPHDIMSEKLGRRGVQVPRAWGAPIH